MWGIPSKFNFEGDSTPSKLLGKGFLIVQGHPQLWGTLSPPPLVFLCHNLRAHNLMMMAQTRQDIKVSTHPILIRWCVTLMDCMGLF